jgi:hypothetical protein
LMSVAALLDDIESCASRSLESEMVGGWEDKKLSSLVAYREDALMAGVTPLGVSGSPPNTGPRMHNPPNSNVICLASVHTTSIISS